MKLVLGFRQVLAQRLLFLSAALVICAILGVSAVPAAAQTSAATVSGRWIWKTVVPKDKSETQFRLVIRRVGKTLKGTYSVDQFVNGEWQGEDGNQTPFVGRAKGNEVEIEFDPSATHPGYEKNVSYVAPLEGRKPSIAVITRSGRKLQWRLMSGDGIGDVPASLLLRRE